MLETTYSRRSEMTALLQVLLLTVSWGIIFWLAERELSNAKPLSTWATALSLPAMIVSALGIVFFTSRFEDTLPQAIWVCPLIGAIAPVWLAVVKADRRTTASVLFGMVVIALISFALWPQPKYEKPLLWPTIEEVTIPESPELKTDDFQFPALPLPNR